LVALTRQGKGTFANMRQREKAVVADLSHTLAGCDLDATLLTLARLHDWLDDTLEKIGRQQ